MLWLILILLVSAAYVAGLPSATLLYVSGVLLRAGLGLLAAAGLARAAYRSKERAKYIPLLLSAALGAYLIFAGATRAHFPILRAHIALAAIGVMLFPRLCTATVVLAIAAVTFRFGGPADRIENPRNVPLSMQGEGAGPKSPFWPSSSNTNTGGLIPSDFFMDSTLCGECHKDIYEQWKGSMHHFASFNNRFYRASILHMQEINGTEGSKWCSGLSRPRGLLQWPVR